MRALLLLAVASLGASTQVPPETPEPAKNEVSVHGAPTLGQWKRAASITTGFPLITVKASMGLFDWLDFGLGFESYYALTAEFLVFFKVGLFRGANWSFSSRSRVKARSSPLRPSVRTVARGGSRAIAISGSARRPCSRTRPQAAARDSSRKSTTS